MLNFYLFLDNLNKNESIIEVKCLSIHLKIVFYSIEIVAGMYYIHANSILSFTTP